MTWFKVDDSLHSHPKVMSCSLAALGLWTVAGSWSGAHLTDGVIPDHMVPLLSRGSIELADELVAAGLWKRAKGGYRFHEWHSNSDGTKRNPSRKEVEADREAARERMRRIRAGQEGSSSTRSSKHVRANNNRTSEELRDPRPEPKGSKEPLEARAKRAALSRGSRIPDDFTITDEMKQWVREKTPHVDGWAETEKFVDYWQAESGAKATKRDWVKAWQVWMRRAEERAGRSNGRGPDLTVVHGSYTPPEPPEHIRDDPQAYREWYIADVEAHRRSQQ